MEDSAGLLALADEVVNARQAIAAAEAAVAKDKLARAQSLMARLADAFTTTAPEAELDAAKARLDAATAKGTSAARNWILESARQSMASTPATAQLHQGCLERVSQSQGRYNQVRNWLDLAQHASNQLEKAQRACESASTTEFLDLLSKSRTVSVLSSLDTSDAADAIKRAHRALQDLSRALPRRTEQGDIGVPDDTLDLVVDFVFDPGLDLLSWLNMDQLDSSAEQCRQARQRLQPLLARLGEVAEAARLKHSHDLAQAQALERPFLEAALALVPEALRGLKPLDL
ncbi:hypothetical protein AACH06_25600 [Ideonella sp. DXS29W]|uniref:Uncharacterized protein n=1 Tax=Ideonella lacteola TaxID=2984193 RepID=A0ABU9BWL1_9BURK